MANKLYVAYGSNLNLKQMAWRCPKAKVIGLGNLKDYQLTFRRVATIEPEKGAITPVGVWEITPADERALDIYGTERQAMVYIMNSGAPMMPPSSYYDTIEQGYNDVGLDLKYLKAALDDTRKRIKAK